MKLFDFGLCTCVQATSHPNDTYEMTGYTGSLRYMAPEVVSRRPYNEKADVYSFGIMLWQMARDKTPFKGYDKDEFVKQVVENHERPKIDKSWPVGFSNLLKACWEAEPAHRPSFRTVIEELNKLMNRDSGITSPPPPPTIIDKEKRKGRMTLSEKSVSSSSWF